MKAKPRKAMRRTRPAARPAKPVKRTAKPARRAASAAAARNGANGAPAGAAVTDTILLDIRDGLATLTLNRPDKLNAFAGDMRERLVAALDRVAADRSVRVLVITGAGTGFCSGGDVQHMVDLKSRDEGFDGLAPLLEAGRAIVTRVAALEIPVIAAVNGVAAGAGCNLALACDVRLASSEARFGETFVRIGLHPDWGGTFHLPRLAGVGPALDLCWTGDLVGAEDALRMGLVQRVYPAKEFAKRWREYARRLAAAPATSVRAAKRTLRAAPGRTLEQCLDAEARAQEACWASADSDEGLRAFVEKRPARFGAEPVEEEAVAPSAAARRFE
jgi:2-(1,2-epoxy-1,2-dihydrophenyl)acetyl-CoA isomerase